MENYLGRKRRFIIHKSKENESIQKIVYFFIGLKTKRITIQLVNQRKRVEFHCKKVVKISPIVFVRASGNEWIPLKRNDLMCRTTRESAVTAKDLSPTTDQLREIIKKYNDHCANLESQKYDIEMEIMRKDYEVCIALPTYRIPPSNQYFSFQLLIPSPPHLGKPAPPPLVLLSPFFYFLPPPFFLSLSFLLIAFHNSPPPFFILSVLNHLLKSICCCYFINAALLSPILKWGSTPLLNN